MQCYDLANYGFNKLFPGYSLQGASAKNIASDNASLLKDKAKIYKNTPSFLAKGGDMVLFPGAYGNGHGHVAWVLSATLNQIVVIENNWLGGGWTYGNAQGGKGWEPATIRVHPYDPNMIFIRPNFKAEKPKPKITWNMGGTFTADRTIKVRRSPGLDGKVVESGSWIYANQWVPFYSVTKKDGYWWIKLKYPTNPSAGYFYMAICKITDKKERIVKEKYWGRVRWK